MSWGRPVNFEKKLEGQEEIYEKIAKNLLAQKGYALEPLTWIEVSIIILFFTKSEQKLLAIFEK